VSSANSDDGTFAIIITTSSGYDHTLLLYGADVANTIFLTLDFVYFQLI